MKVAVVILNWNGSNMLRRFLPTVMRYSSQQATVIVADNASTDNSLEVLEKEFPNCSTIVLSENYGFAGGYNKALAQVKADYYVLLNSDVEVTEGWLTPLISFMETHLEVAACQPKLLSEQDKTSFEYAGGSGGFIDKYGYPFCRGRIFDTIEVDKGQYDKPMSVFWATGACLMVRSSDYWAVNGLDNSFFAHNEEIDFCWRLQLLGKKIYCLPNSVVYHVGGGTLPKSNPMKTFLNFRNNLAMLYKNLPEAELHKVLRVRCFLDYVAALQFLIQKRSWKDFVAVLKARREFKKRIPKLKKQRQRLHSQSMQEPKTERKMYSILWQYYVKKRKQFSSIEPLH